MIFTNFRYLDSVYGHRKAFLESIRQWELGLGDVGTLGFESRDLSGFAALINKEIKHEVELVPDVIAEGSNG